MKYTWVYICIALLLVSMAYADCTTLDDDKLIQYYSFDNSTITGSVVADLKNSYDGDLLSGAVGGKAGIMGDAVYCDGANDYINATLKMTPYSWGNFSVNFWVKTTTAVNPFLWGVYAGGAGGEYLAVEHYNTNQLFYVSSGLLGGVLQTEAISSAANTTWRDGNWHMITFTEDGDDYTNFKIYLDSFLMSSSMTANNNPNTIPPGTLQNYICGRNNAGNMDNPTAMTIDEWSVHNRTLSQSDINNLFNSGSGCNITAGAAPPADPGGTNLTLNWTLYNGNYSLTNTSYIITNASGTYINTSFAFTISNGTLVDNFTMIVWENGYLGDPVIAGTNYTPNITHSIIWDVTGRNDSTNYYLYVAHASAAPGISVNLTRYVSFDMVYPELQLLSTISNNSIYYHNITDQLNVTLNYQDTNLYAANFTIYVLNGSTRMYAINTTQVTGINTTDYNITRYLDMSYLNNSAYEIFGAAWDSHTNNQVRPLSWYFDDNNLIADGDIMFIGDFKEMDGKGNPATYFYLSDDRYKLKITFEDTSITHDIIINASDLKYLPNSQYKGHMIYWPNKRWIDFEGTNVASVTVDTLASDTYAIHVSHVYPTDEIEFESIGDLNYKNSSWYFNVSDPYVIYARDAFSNATISNFTINILDNTTLVQSASTTNGAVILNISSGNYSTNITSASYTPNATAAFTFVPGGNFTYYLYAANSLYFFFYDEETDTLITDVNITLQVISAASANQYTVGDGSEFISGFTPGDYTIYYGGGGYRTRSYFTTIADNSTQSIDLYCIKNTSSNLIVFQLLDEKDNPVFNATLKAKRFMIADNAYLIVDMEKTDANGETAMYLAPYDVYYEFVVDNANGAQIFRGDAQKIYASNIYLRVPLLTDVLYSMQIAGDTTRNLSYNNVTKYVSYYWNDGTGIVMKGCLEVYKSQILGETLLFSQCTASNSATILFNMTNYLLNNTDYIAKGWIETNTSSSSYYDIFSFSNYVTHDRFGLPGLFFSYLLIGTMFFLGLPFSFGAAVIYSVLSMVALQLIGVSYFGFAMIATISIVGFIIAVVNKI